MALVAKRKGDDLINALSSKRQKIEDRLVRRSSLLAPVMELSGHTRSILCGKFSPDGTLFASAGMDRIIRLWNTSGECDNFCSMHGHKGAIIDLQISSDGSRLYTASTDKTVGIWDLETGARIAKKRGHLNFVNSCNPHRHGPDLICSGGDDGEILIWDVRKRNAIKSLTNHYQVTAVTFANNSDTVISGGIDNDIKMWDVRNGVVSCKLTAHSDTVTGLELSPDGSYLLSNAMDKIVRIWDVRSFVLQSDRCSKIFYGLSHDHERFLLRASWSPDGSMVSAGSSDQFVYIWDTTTMKILYKLPGHHGSVNETDFHPTEPIISSVSSDMKIYFGEM